MSMPLTMTGHDRTYRPPRSLRDQLGAEVTAWDLFRLEHDEQAGGWASSTLAALVSSVEAETADVLGCTECLDTGFYGEPDSDNPDLLVRLVRRVGDDRHETLTADGRWVDAMVERPMEVLDQETAADLGAAIVAGAAGLLRLYGQPRAFLPPKDCVTAEPLSAVISAGADGTPQEMLAVVHEIDQGAILDLARITATGVTQVLEGDRWIGADLGEVPIVRLSEAQRVDVLRQMASSDAMVADAPLTVSPDPRAERLRRYWSTGRGGAKIRWNTPHDWVRCYRHLRKYMGLRAKPYCQNLHRRNTGMWTGDRRNRGLLSSANVPPSIDTPETALLAALRSGRVSGATEGKTTMPDTLTDGVYTEVDDSDSRLLQALAASAIPVAAPDAWFEDPKLDKVTTITCTDEGRVFGHLAPWGGTHIGMAGDVQVPHNRSGSYAYFRTGQHITASGKSVRVGQLTLTGGHAPTDPGVNVASVVRHYDDTASAIADVAAGEDAHGIWVAGALRPGVTPEQIRVMRASPPSGDWRRINGEMELVAACHVNVQGFPIAACAYHSGAVEALVAAGARRMAELRLAEHADDAIVSRLAQLEQLVASIGATATIEALPAEVGEAELAEVADPAEPAAAAPEPTAEEQARADLVARTRQEITDAKREALRKRVRATAGSGVTAAMSTAERKGKSTISGTDSFPIGNVGDLKNAIQAFGRAGDKAAAKKHIISMAYKLKRPDLIPDGWRSGK